MFADPEFWRQLSAEIKDEFDARAGHMTTGNVPTERYREEVGYLRGLQFVRDKAEEIVKRMSSRGDSEQPAETGIDLYS